MFVAPSLRRQCVGILTRFFSSNETKWPKAVTLSNAGKTLTVEFNDGKRFLYSAELLRVLSPAANSVRPARSGPKLLAGRRHVGIIAVEQVGNYAINLSFDDLHNSGIYSWDALYDLGTNKFRRSREYLRQLRGQGLSRDPVLRRVPAPK